MLFPWRRRLIIRFTSPNLLGFTHCIRTNRLGFWIFKIQMLNEIEVLGAGRCQVIVILTPIFIKLIQVLSFQNLLLQKWQASRCYKRTRAFIPIFFTGCRGVVQRNNLFSMGGGSDVCSRSALEMFEMQEQVYIFGAVLHFRTCYPVLATLR